jgi:hypothetical protein
MASLWAAAWGQSLRLQGGARPRVLVLALVVAEVRLVREQAGVERGTLVGVARRGRGTGRLCKGRVGPAWPKVPLTSHPGRPTSMWQGCRE